MKFITVIFTLLAATVAFCYDDIFNLLLREDVFECILDIEGEGCPATIIAREPDNKEGICDVYHNEVCNRLYEEGVVGLPKCDALDEETIQQVEVEIVYNMDIIQEKCENYVPPPEVFVHKRNSAGCLFVDNLNRISYDNPCKEEGNYKWKIPESGSGKWKNVGTGLYIGYDESKNELITTDDYSSAIEIDFSEGNIKYNGQCFIRNSQYYIEADKKCSSNNYWESKVTITTPVTPTSTKAPSPTPEYDISREIVYIIKYDSEGCVYMNAINKIVYTNPCKLDGRCQWEITSPVVVPGKWKNVGTGLYIGYDKSKNELIATADESSAIDIDISDFNIKYNGQCFYRNEQYYLEADPNCSNEIYWLPVIKDYIGDFIQPTTTTTISSKPTGTGVEVFVHKRNSAGCLFVDSLNRILYDNPCKEEGNYKWEIPESGIGKWKNVGTGLYIGYNESTKELITTKDESSAIVIDFTEQNIKYNGQCFIRNAQYYIEADPNCSNANYWESKINITTPVVPTTTTTTTTISSKPTGIEVFVHKRNSAGCLFVDSLNRIIYDNPCKEEGNYKWEIPESGIGKWKNIGTGLYIGYNESTKELITTNDESSAVVIDFTEQNIKYNGQCFIRNAQYLIEADPNCSNANYWESKINITTPVVPNASSSTTTITTTTTTTTTKTPISTRKPISRDGRCGEEFGTTCSQYECCSQHGYCGVTDEYCGQGCQSGFGYCSSGTPVVKTTSTKTSTSSKAPQPTSNEKPLTADGKCGKEYGTTCGEYECCSQHGYCGVTEEYCGQGCQSGFGFCLSDNNNPSTDVPISTVSGRCGPRYGRCEFEDHCCSEYGYCGVTSEYCGTGCQKLYGICN